MVQVHGYRHRGGVRGRHDVPDEVRAVEVQAPREQLDYSWGSPAFGGADHGLDAVIVVAGFESTKETAWGDLGRNSDDMGGHTN